MDTRTITSKLTYSKFYLLVSKDKKQTLYLFQCFELNRKKKSTLKYDNYIYCSPDVFNETLHFLCYEQNYEIKADKVFPFSYAVSHYMYFPKGEFKITTRKYPVKYVMTVNDGDIEVLYNLMSIDLFKYGNKKIIVIGDSHEGHFQEAPRNRGVMHIESFCRNLIDLYSNITFLLEGTNSFRAYKYEQDGLVTVKNLATMRLQVDGYLLLAKNIHFPDIDIRWVAENMYRPYYSTFVSETLGSEAEKSEKFIERSFKIIRNTKDYNTPLRKEALKILKDKEDKPIFVLQSRHVDAFSLLAIDLSPNDNIVLHAGHTHTQNIGSVLKKYSEHVLSLVSKKISPEIRKKKYPWRSEISEHEQLIKISRENSVLLTSFFSK